MDSPLERRGSTCDRLKPAPCYDQPVTFTYAIQSHTTRMQRLTNAFRVYRLMALTLVCVLAGLLVGLLCRPAARTWSERHYMYIEFPGELYLRFLRLMIIPLLVSNVILSFGTIHGKISSRLAKVAGLLYVATNLAAVSVAIVCAIAIGPGGAHKPLLNGAPAPLANGASQPRGTALGVDLQSSELAFDGKRLSEQLAAQRRAEMRAREAAAATLGVRREGRENGSPWPLVGADGPNGAKQADHEQADGAKRNQINLSTKLPIDVVLDVLRNLIPDSLVGAALQQSRTRLKRPRELRVHQNGSTEPAPNRWPMGHEQIEQPNIVGLLAMSVLTGVVLSRMGEAARPLLDLCACVSELSLRVGMKAIHLAPFCIMFLLIGQVARARDLSSIAGELFMYSLTVCLALLIHGLVILPLAYYCLTKKSPLAFLAGLLEALVASFATSSSSSTMALTLNCLTSLKLNLVIVRAFGPLGSVFNMNGTTIFEAIAVIFIAQTLNVSLPLTSLLLVGLCSAVASLSTAGIPSSGMMTMVIVLNAINLPVLELSLIYIVDFIIDRFRTVVNVWSGALVCGLIDHICPEELFEEEMKPEKYREMVKYRASRGSLGGRKASSAVEEKPQVICVTITPPDESSKI